MKTTSYEVAELRPVARKIRASWEEREQYIFNIEISYELEAYLKVIRKWCRLDDLNQAATVLAVHRIKRANHFRDTCSFRTDAGAVFAGFGFEAEYANPDCWRLLEACAGQCRGLVDWLGTSRIQTEWDQRAEMVLKMSRFVRNDIVPFAQLGVLRGMNGGDFFRDVADAMQARATQGPLGVNDEAATAKFPV